MRNIEDATTSLPAMHDDGLCCPLEIVWLAFGPIPNTTVPLRDDPGCDGRAEIPAELVVDRQRYRPTTCRSVGGALDFRAMYGWRSGAPIVFVFGRLNSPTRRVLPVFFGADWFTRWWVNGKLVYDASGGNVVKEDDISFHRFQLPLQKGENIIQVKVGSGTGGWNIRMGVSDRPPKEPGGRRCAVPRNLPGLRPATRDYSRTGLRLEYRNRTQVPGAARRKEEPLLRAAGVESRWIQVFDSRSHGHIGSPFYRNPYLAASKGADAGSKRRLQQWVRAIHASGMPVLSWCPLCYSYEARQAHPDWASRPFPGDEDKLRGDDFAHCCIHSPFGDALVKFVAEAVAEIDLDGIWFDGGHFAPGIWAGCACQHCRKKFEAEEGVRFPAKVDWANPAFRRWVKWRYRAFVEYWGRLVGAIRRARPAARVAINHLHRPDVASTWLKGCPLALTGLPIIGGTEGSSLAHNSGFITRLTRAYGYTEVENWMDFGLLHRALDGNVVPYIHHALSCMTAGGMPSYGPLTYSPALGALAAIINPRAPWVGGETVPHVGLHISDQAETFRFARFAPQVYRSVYPHGYWNSVLGWNNLLAETQCLTDVIFDAHLDIASLSRYPVVVLPLSVALDDTQLAVLTSYVRDGGVLVVGPWFGSCDEWGQPADARRVRSLLGTDAERPPRTDRQDAIRDAVTIRPLGCGNVVRLSGDVGGRFHARRSRRLAEQVAVLLRRLAPPTLCVNEGPNVHVGLFRRVGELILHVQNAVGYSQTLGSSSSPLLRPPSVRKGIQIELRGFPVRKAEMVTGEGRRKPMFHLGTGVARIVVPELDWGAVFRLEIG